MYLRCGHFNYNGVSHLIIFSIPMQKCDRASLINGLGPRFYGFNAVKLFNIHCVYACIKLICCMVIKRSKFQNPMETYVFIKNHLGHYKEALWIFGRINIQHFPLNQKRFAIIKASQGSIFCFFEVGTWIRFRIRCRNMRAHAVITPSEALREWNKGGDSPVELHSASHQNRTVWNEVAYIARNS